MSVCAVKHLDRYFIIDFQQRFSTHGIQTQDEGKLTIKIFFFWSYNGPLYFVNNKMYVTSKNILPGECVDTFGQQHHIITSIINYG